MNNWFPFFSMMFWFFTKVGGLALFLFGLNLASFWVASGFSDFWRGLLQCSVPMVIGFLVLKSDVIHEIATEGMRRQQPQKPS